MWPLGAVCETQGGGAAGQPRLLGAGKLSLETIFFLPGKNTTHSSTILSEFK